MLRKVYKNFQRGIKLINIRQEKLKGHMLRSKAQYTDEGEKPTKYFCGLEKHNYI